MKKNTIAILLATYNSSNYLEEQLKSILNQTDDDWCVYCRDDGSTDTTREIIEHYINEYSGKFYMIYDELRLGACRSFMALLAQVESQYYMFCDHDDVWLPEKLALSRAKMAELERENMNQPIIVHTDMYVVNSDLSVRASSFWQYMRLLPQYNTFYDLLACNNVNGCTMMFNRKVKEVSLPNVERAQMHDCWVALCVAAQSNGVIAYLPTKTVLYRQHGSNVLGAQKISTKYFLSKCKNIVALLRHPYRVKQRYGVLRNISLFNYVFNKAKIVCLRMLM